MRGFDKRAEDFERRLRVMDRALKGLQAVCVGVMGIGAMLILTVVGIIPMSSELFRWLLLGLGVCAAVLLAVLGETMGKV